MTPCRPQAVAFDVVETLISLEPLRRRFVEIGLHATALERWFDRILRDGMALTLVGDYAPFPDAASASLRVVGVVVSATTRSATFSTASPRCPPSRMPNWPWSG